VAIYEGLDGARMPDIQGLELPVLRELAEAAWQVVPEVVQLYTTYAGREY
jgi:hypothetical protein